MDLQDSTLWWLLAGSLVAVELVTGTFYLLALAVGAVAGAIAAHGRLMGSAPEARIIAIRAFASAQGGAQCCFTGAVNGRRSLVQQ